MAKVLVVEDEQDLRELYVDLLRKAGYEVDFAVDGQIAVEKMEDGGWDLILLDIILPKVDGLTVLQLMAQKTPKKPNGPIVLLTALANEQMIQRGISIGAAGYLIKSEVTPDKIVEEVGSFLEKAV